jgi:DNA-binding NarL/FixJ family response regulator
MFMVASRAVNKSQTENINSTTDVVLVVGDTDLFSECLVEALGKKFPVHDVYSVASSKPLPENQAGDVKLVLLYRITGQPLNDMLRYVRMEHPKASIGLVVDATDMIEPFLKQLVETRYIDGVLPLNLRLDVFMAAVDLMMKGGEHFPSALLGKLTGRSMSQDNVVFEAKAVVANRADALAARQGEFAALTTREVQILDLLCKGTQNKIIADKLHLSENTVKVHVRNIYKKLNVRNRTEAASRFFNTDTAEKPLNGWRN